MIHIMIGTKGQLTKMAPIFKELDNRNIEYNFIRTGQHTKIIDVLIEKYNLKQPDYAITKREADLKNIFECVIWMIKCLVLGFIHRKEMFKNDKGGIVLIHGDTESTLISAILCKLSGMKVGHVEAGLRSFDIWNPFPEELIRRITSYFSDYMFCPNQWSIDNLKKHKSEKINTYHNTVFDTVKLVLNKIPEIKPPKEKYVIFGIHRKESLYNNKNFKKLILILLELSQHFKIIFIMHGNTKHKLKTTWTEDILPVCMVEKILYNYLKVYNIEYKEYYDHISFMHLVKNSEFVATDGGSLQEETYMLNKPYLILRYKTERIEGLDETAYLSELNMNKVEQFIQSYKNFTRKLSIDNVKPSKIIVDYLMGELK